MGIIPYSDDIPIPLQRKLPQTSLGHTALPLKLDCLINWDKSYLIPKRVTFFLEYESDLLQQMTFLPAEKIWKLRNSVLVIQGSSGILSVRQIMSLLGIKSPGTLMSPSSIPPEQLGLQTTKSRGANVNPQIRKGFPALVEMGEKKPKSRHILGKIAPVSSLD